MKKLLIALLIAPACCQAQFEFGINAGFAPLISSTDIKIREFGHTIQTNEVSKWPGSGTMENITGCYRFLGMIKAGLGFEFSGQYNQMNSPFIFMEYSKIDGKNEVTAGIRSGLIYFNNNFQTQCSANGIGYSFGLHIGYNRKIAKQMFINVTAEYELVTATAKGTWDYSPETYIVPSSFLPVTIGIHYKLLTPKKRNNGRRERNTKGL